MLTTAFFVTLETRKLFNETEYTEACAEIVAALSRTLGEVSKLREIMGSVELRDARVEVEVAQVTDKLADGAAPITARTAVQVEAPEKLAFNKAAFAAFLRFETSIPMTISKRAISKEELAPYKD